MTGVSWRDAALTGRLQGAADQKWPTRTWNDQRRRRSTVGDTTPRTRSGLVLHVLLVTTVVVIVGAGLHDHGNTAPATTGEGEPQTRQLPHASHCGIGGVSPHDGGTRPRTSLPLPESLPRSGPM